MYVLFKSDALCLNILEFSWVLAIQPLETVGECEFESLDVMNKFNENVHSLSGRLIKLTKYMVLHCKCIIMCGYPRREAFCYWFRCFFVVIVPINTNFLAYYFLCN